MKRKNLFHSIVLSLGVFCLLLFTQCDDGNKEPVQEGTGGKLYMNRLRLNAEAYDTLKASGGTKLVFQFFYPGAETCQSPTLYVYPMMAMNQSTDKPPLILQYDSVSTEPFTGRAQVLGDQQMRMSSMDSLLKQVSGPYTGKNYYFLFTPKFQGDNPHVYYDISLNGPDGRLSGTSRTNPSPPASIF